MMSIRPSEALLDGVLDLIRAQNRRPIYRSLVAIANHQAGTREVVATSHLSTDPELHMSKPIDFGVAGEAFITRSVRAADVDDTNRDVARDGTHVVGIWPETRSVLAFPMIAADNSAFGTLNFDSNDTLAVSRNVSATGAPTHRVYEVDYHPQGSTRRPTGQLVLQP